MTYVLTLLSIAGIAIAVVVFLNLINAGGHNAKVANAPDLPRVNVRRHLQKTAETKHPRLRVCPLCGTVLDRTDYLFASFSEAPPSLGRRQAHIYGCRHCYATDGVNVGMGRMTGVDP